MATTRSVSTITRASISLTALAAAADAAGDNFANTGNEFLYVNNGGGSSVTVTLVAQATLDGQSVTNKTVAVAAGIARLIGPFPKAIYNDANDRMNITWSDVTSVTVAAIKLTPGQ